MLRRSTLLSISCLLLTGTGFAQLSPAAIWAVESGNQYRVSPNVTYHTADGVELKMDIYSRRDTATAQPTLVFMHGGFWVAGTKEGSLFSLIPWMEMGWNVVNVEYRLGPTHLAPAAVEDVFCALRFVANRAEQYNFDTSRLVVSGRSAGGHLALVIGMMPDSAGFADSCAGEDTPRVAAVINWFGVTDVPDVIDGPNRAEAAARWFGDIPIASSSRAGCPLSNTSERTSRRSSRYTGVPTTSSLTTRAYACTRPSPRRERRISY
jgi:acetyl esterase/lipase